MSGEGGYTFNRATTWDGLRQLAALYVMDAWEVDPPGWDPQWYRHAGRDCHNIWMCSGCNDWQVQCRVNVLAADIDDPDAEQPFMAAVDLADEHRADCPPLDMLAGLRGVPTPGHPVPLEDFDFS